MQNPRKQVLAKTFPDVFDMNRLSEKLEKLSSFKANVLRTVTLGAIEWEKVDGKWKGGVKVSVMRCMSRTAADLLCRRAKGYRLAQCLQRDGEASQSVCGHSSAL